jgi:hypothetical protein
MRHYPGSRTAYRGPNHTASRDPATGEYFYRGRWYDPTEECDMEALEHKIGEEWEAVCE